MERIAPRSLAQDWDRERIGLAVGSPEAEVQTVMVALDPTLAVIEEAIAAGAGLLITHHPFLFHPLSAVRTDLPSGRAVARALAGGLALFSAHTNLDSVEGGVSSVLAERLGLGDAEPLEAGGEPLVKLAVFVPESHVEEVRQALGRAGAGHLGNYSHCTFGAPGTGTFLPGEGTQPFLGRPGELERVAEVRLETILPERLLGKVLAAMLKAHPYEEVAYDVYPLKNRGPAAGLGRVGRLGAAASLAEMVERVKAALDVTHVAYLGDPNAEVQKVAVCGGSAGDLVAKAAYRGADLLVAGEVKYHEGQNALESGLAVIAAGHDATERLVVPALARRLREEFERLRLDLQVLEERPKPVLWRLG